MHEVIRLTSLTASEMQCTMTDEYSNDEWVCAVRGEKVVPLKQWHYRIVFGTVGYPLKRFKDTAELLHATFDVFHGVSSFVCPWSYV